MPFRRPALFGLFLITLPLASQAQDKNPPDTKTRAVMASFLHTMEKLLPLSLNGEAFKAKENKATISAYLNTLSESSQHLTDHFQSSKSEEYNYIADSIARDTRELKELYNEAQYEKARFIIHNISRNCVSCHLKVPPKKDYPNPAALFAKLDTKTLNPLEKAHFKVMVRQFDDAMSLFEQEFAAQPTLNTIAFAEYLKLSLRVARSPERALKVIDKALAKSPPKEQKALLEVWKRHLQKLIKEKTLQKVELAEARQLVALTQDDKSLSIFGRESLVYNVAASAILHQLLNEKKLPRQKKAEIYYLLGLTEEWLADSFWLSETENYLEQAIRLAPKTDLAAKAYRLLSDQYVLGYSGSSGTHLPADVVSLLKELKQLAGVKDDAPQP